MRIFIVLFFIFAAGVSTSLAHPGGGGGLVREACKADAGTLCQGIRPGHGRIRACLKSNRDRVSQGCKSAIADRHASPARRETGERGATVRIRSDPRRIAAHSDSIRETS